MIVILTFLLFYIVKSQDYSWILISNFNYNKPHKAILNVAYPASIAFYYITVIPPGSNYSFEGEFLKKDVYESSLTVYNSNGLTDPDFNSINTFNTNDKVIYNVNNEKLDLLYILQRFYINLDIYDEDDMINNLFEVYDNKKEKYLKTVTKEKRYYYSSMIYRPLQTFISWISPRSNSTFSQFYLPGVPTGLFPDTNHYYLRSTPGIFNLFKVTGYFVPEKRFPYIDFITTNQLNVSTDNGIPFYEFLKDDNTYEIYVSTHKVSDKDILKIDKNAKILRWRYDNDCKSLIFRLIDYTNYGLANATGPLTPNETRNLMNGFYPKIEIIDI